MNPKWLWCAALLCLIWPATVYAETVYFWTDENGVRHYSNTGIPGDVQEAEERPEEISPEVSPSPADAGIENELDRDLPQDQTGAPGEEEPVVVDERDERLAARVESERERLLSEIEQIEGLAIGKSFTPGMKAARIAPLKEQLALLDADPQRYFRMKRQGAFGDAESEDYVTPSPDALIEPLEPLEPISSAGPGADEEELPQQQE